MVMIILKLMLAAVGLVVLIMLIFWTISRVYWEIEWRKKKYIEKDLSSDDVKIKRGMTEKKCNKKDVL